MSKSKEYRRIVVKAGTSLLTKGSGRLDVGVVSNIVSQISNLQSGGYQMVMVTSGAVAVGQEVLAGIEKRGGVPERQVLAAVGQGRLMNIYDGEFSRNGTISAQALLSRSDVNDRLRYLNVRNTIIGLIKRGVVPIINENDVVAVDELTSEVFGDNDNLVPVATAEAYQRSMHEFEIRSELHVFSGEEHGFFNWNRDKSPNKANYVATLVATDAFLSSLGYLDGEERVVEWLAPHR